MVAFFPPYSRRDTSLSLQRILLQVVVVDMVTGKAQTWEPCENRSLARLGGSSPAMITAYWGTPETHCIEVDKLSTVTVNANPQVRRVALPGL